MPISVDNAVGDKYTCLAKKLSNYIYGSKIHMCQNPNCFWELITLQQSVVYIGKRVISQKFPNLPRKCIKLCVVCIWNYAEFLKYRTPSYRSLTHTALFHHKKCDSNCCAVYQPPPPTVRVFLPMLCIPRKKRGSGSEQTTTTHAQNHAQQWGCPPIYSGFVSSRNAPERRS